MTKDELKSLIRECIEEVVNEDKEEISESVIAIYEEVIDDDILNESNENVKANKATQKKVLKKVLKVFKNFMASEGEADIRLKCSGISSNNNKFLKGTGKTIKIQISSRDANTRSWIAAANGSSGYDSRNVDKTEAAVKNAAKIVKENNAELKKKVEEEVNMKVASITVEKGKWGSFDIVLRFE